MGKATIKKDMIKAGQLDKYGKPNENTPKNWTSSYVDFNLKTEAVTPKVEGEVTPKVEGERKRKASEEGDASPNTTAEAPAEETEEEKAARKAAKKAKKKAKKEAGMLPQLQRQQLTPL